MTDATLAAAHWRARHAQSHHRLSEAEVEAFGRNGFHFPVRVFEPDVIAGHRQRLEAFEQRMGGPLGGQMRNKPHLLFTWVDEIVRHPAILDEIGRAHV